MKIVLKCEFSVCHGTEWAMAMDGNNRFDHKWIEQYRQ